MPTFKVKDLMITVGAERPAPGAIDPRAALHLTRTATIWTGCGWLSPRTCGWISPCAPRSIWTCAWLSPCAYRSLPCPERSVIACDAASIDIPGCGPTLSPVIEDGTTVVINPVVPEAPLASLATLKDALKARLAEVEAAERTAAAELEPRTVDEAQALEARLSEALEEVRALKGRLGQEKKKA